MFDFKQAYKDIQEVKKKIKGLSFEDAAKVLGAYHSDSELFDYNYGSIDGTVWNENGKAKIDKDTCYDVFDTTGFECADDPYEVFHGTEKEIKERIK